MLEKYPKKRYSAAHKINPRFQKTLLQTHGEFMYKNLKKMWPLSIAFVAATSFVNAANDSAQLRNLENRVNALEQRRSASGMINPPGRPQVRDGVDLFLFGELLYWNAHENGLPVAIVNHASSANLSKSEVRSIHSHWDVGFRVGVGYNLPHDGWDLSLSWLRLNTGWQQKNQCTQQLFCIPFAH